MKFFTKDECSIQIEGSIGENYVEQGYANKKVQELVQENADLKARNVFLKDVFIKQKKAIADYVNQSLRISELENALKLVIEADHESGCLGKYNHESCDCLVSIVQKVLDKGK